MRKYIRNCIIRFFNDGNIIYTDDIINQIEAEVYKGVYAFQVIYEEADMNIYEFKLLKPLYYKNVLYNDKYEIYSYDGGKTYKYSKYETLLIDLKVIRNIKLNDLLK